MLFNAVKGATPLIMLVVSVLLYFVMFFGIAFIINMLVRTTWFMAFLYPIVAILIIDGISTFDYLTNTGEAFRIVGETLASLQSADYIIIGSGFIGTIVAGFTIRILRKSGYRMF